MIITGVADPMVAIQAAISLPAVRVRHRHSHRQLEVEVDMEVAAVSLLDFKK